MITIRKLRTLKPGSRLRKIARILNDYERSPVSQVNRGYVIELFSVLSETLPHDASYQITNDLSQSEWVRVCNSARHSILRYLGTEPADWDMYNPEDPVYAPEVRFPISLFLEDIRSPFNVGSIFRTAAAMGAGKIFLSPDTPTPHQQRVLRSSMGATTVVEWEVVDAPPSQTTLIALETGGTPIDSFEFPAEGTVIIGSEELGVSPMLLETARTSGGIVSIPMVGAKASLNVGVSVGVLMQRWTSFLQSL